MHSCKTFFFSCDEKHWVFARRNRDTDIQEILWPWFWHLISRKALKTLMLPLFYITSSNLHKTSRKLLQECVPDWMYSCFTKITCILTFSPTSLEQFEIVSQTSLRCCFPGYSSHFAPKQNNSQLSYCDFFPLSVDVGIVERIVRKSLW